MPTKTFPISKDTLLAKSGSTALGGGADPHLPVGYWSGYNFRAALQFALDWTGVTAITSARLYLRTTGQTHVAFGSDPDILIDRLTGSFSENSAKGSADGGSGWSTSPSNYDDVTSWTTSGEATLDVSTSENAWVSVDITDIVTAWAPASIGGGGATNYGIIIRPVTAGSSAETTEFYGQESSYDPYIVLTYVSNTAPNAPTLSSPVGGSRVTDLTPTLAFVHSDPQGDACASYDVQVATDAGLTSLIVNVSGQTSGITGNNIAYTLGDLSAYRGQTLYWRARTVDPSGLVGAWAAVASFKVNSLPSATKTSPASNGLAHVWNLASDLAVWTSGGSHAKARFSWGFSDADGDGQTAYQVRVYDLAAGGSLLYDSGKVASSATQHDSTYALVLGTAYYWTIEVWDAYDESSGESSRTAFKVRWGQAIYEYAPAGGSGSSSWDFTADSPAADTQQAFLFATATGAAGVGRSAWATDIGALTPDAYLNVLVRLSADVTGTQPVLGAMEFSYVGSAIQPDKWSTQATNAADWVLDPSVRRFGTQAFRCRVSTTSGNRYVYPYRNVVGDDVIVQPNTQYTLSAFVRTSAPLASGAALRLMVYPAGSLGTALIDGGADGDDSDSSTTSTAAYSEGWQRLLLTFTTGSGVTRIRPMVHYRHNGSTSGDIFWVDAVKLEEGTVATAWTPGFVGDPVVLDSGGIAVDASAGGIFRLRGAAGGSRDIIDLGDNGLVLGGDIPIRTGASGNVTIGDETVGGLTLELAGGPSGDEGAEFHLNGAGSNTDWYLDNFAGTLRFFTNPGGSVRLTVQDATPHVAVTGDLSVSGAITAETPGVICTAAGTAQTGVAAGTTSSNLAFGTRDFDTGTSYDTTNKRWVVPTGKGGLYVIVAVCNVVNQTAAAGSLVRFACVKNGVSTGLQCEVMGAGGSNVKNSIVGLLVLAAGDTIGFTGGPIINSADVSLSEVMIVRLHAGTIMA